MCQSKADGGRRCKFHLEQGVANGMTTYVASVTGLSAQQTNEAYTALEREGRNAPDPTREEVDAFLEREAFRVRYEPNLTEKRRESIVARLRAAIGRITPSGATFHAWKNLVAESWSRVRRKAAAAFVVGAMTFSVGACGSAPEQPTAAETVAPVASAPLTPGDQVRYDTTFETAEPTINPAAATKFGRGEALAGTDAAVSFSERYFYDDDAVTTKGGVDLDKYATPLGQHMTPTARADWNTSVKGFVTDVKNGELGANKGSWDVLSVTFYGAMAGTNKDSEGKVTVANPDGPVMVNKTIENVTTGVATDGRLSVSMKSSADMRLLIDGQPKRWHLTRDITYYMVKDSSGVWKIDAWSGNWAPGKVTAEK